VTTEGSKLLGPGDKPLINRNERADQAAARKRSFRSGATRVSNPPPQRRIVRQFLDASRKPGGISGRMDEGVDSGCDELRGPARLAHDNRFAAGHGFGNDEPKRLGLGTRVHHDIERPNRKGRVLDEAGESQAHAKTELVRLGAELV
jgi:hypothetical protein